MKWACLGAAAFTVAARVALLPWWPTPQPRYHDEFAYLLGADTFASGRLANPAHPLWEHFETPHVNSRPTYMSKYPPAQSAVLALGQLLGDPWYGVVLSGAGFAAALCWMLGAWLPVGWALGGAVYAVASFGLTGYWMNSYWGGFVAATGGALALGAAKRLGARADSGAALAGVAGVALLAISRPFEGALVCGCCAWLAGRAALRREVVVGGLVLVLGMGFFNWCATGNPTVAPYQIHQKEYAAAPVFWWMGEVPQPAYRHDTIKRLWEWDRGYYRNARENPLFVVGSLFTQALPYLVAWPLVPPLLWGGWRLRGVAAMVGAFLAAMCLTRWLLPHYLAPVAGLLVLLVVTGLRAMPRYAAVALVVAGLGWRSNFLLAYDSRFVKQRAAVLERLERDPARHLVVVRYGPKQSIHDEWVYNRADIDASRIVWARELGDNRRLLEHFRGRKLWLLDEEARLTPFEPPPHSANPNGSR